MSALWRYIASSFSLLVPVINVNKLAMLTEANCAGRHYVNKLVMPTEANWAKDHIMLAVILKKMFLLHFQRLKGRLYHFKVSFQAVVVSVS